MSAREIHSFAFRASLYQNPANGTCLCLANIHFVGPPVELLKGFAFHRLLHLRVFLACVGVPLSQQLDNPFVGNTAGTEARRVRGTEIVNPGKRSTVRPLLGRAALTRVACEYSPILDRDDEIV